MGCSKKIGAWFFFFGWGGRLKTNASNKSMNFRPLVHVIIKAINGS